MRVEKNYGRSINSMLEAIKITHGMLDLIDETKEELKIASNNLGHPVIRTEIELDKLCHLKEMLEVNLAFLRKCYSGSGTIKKLYN